MDVLEIDAATGERVERDFTPDELAQRELDEAADTQRKADEAKAQAAADKATADAIAHAKSLGFTDPMIAVMYPQLTEA